MPEFVMYENLFLFIQNFLAISLSRNMVVNKMLLFSQEFPDQFSLVHFRAQQISAAIEEVVADKLVELLAPP